MKILAVTAAGVLFALLSSASAQSQLRGNYDLVSGYDSGPGLGTFGYGTATVSRDGRAAYTVYYPLSDDSGAGSGQVNTKGVFVLNNGVSGRVRLLSKVIDAIGEFSDDFGSGFFGLTKKR
jgi:hypothetical protein